MKVLNGGRAVKHARRFVGFFLGIGSVLYLSVEIRKIDFSILGQANASLLACAVISGLVGRLFFLLAWMEIAAAEKTRVDGRLLVDAWGKAWLARYVPGKAGLFYFKYRGLKDSRAESEGPLKLAAFETLLGLLVSIYVGFTCLLASLGYFYVCIVLTAAVASVWFFLAPLLEKRSTLFPTRTGRRLGRSAIFHVLGNLMALPSLFLVLQSLGLEIGIVDLLFLQGSNVLAGVLGTLAIFAPAGLGIKDAGMLRLSTAVLPGDAAVTLVVVLRAVAVLADLLCGGFAVLGGRFTRQFHPRWKKTNNMNKSHE